MKKVIRLLIILVVLCSFGVIGFSSFSNKIVKEANALENKKIDILKVANGVYEGHSELGPVIVDVEVSVIDGRIIDINLVRHENGLGSSANNITNIIKEKNSCEVDAISGATVSSKVIINAVNNALASGL